MTKKEQILELRAQGLTYRSIAQQVGHSFQYVALVCGQADKAHFRPVKPEECVFSGLRAWMNENTCSRRELLRRMGYASNGNIAAKLRRILRGEQTLSKDWIDLMLGVTGLTYEVLFATENSQTDEDVSTRRISPCAEGA